MHNWTLGLWYFIRQKDLIFGICQNFYLIIISSSIKSLSSGWHFRVWNELKWCVTFGKLFWVALWNHSEKLYLFMEFQWGLFIFTRKWGRIAANIIDWKTYFGCQCGWLLAICALQVISLTTNIPLVLDSVRGSTVVEVQVCLLITWELTYSWFIRRFFDILIYLKNIIIRVMTILWFNKTWPCTWKTESCFWATLLWLRSVFQGDKMRRRNDWRNWPPLSASASPRHPSARPNYDALGSQLAHVGLEEVNSGENIRGGEAQLGRSASGELNSQAQDGDDSGQMTAQNGSGRSFGRSDTF